MKKFYHSNFYQVPIEVETIWWETLVSIQTAWWKKIIYSWYNIQERTSYCPYINKCLLGSFIKKIPKHVLILWMWGWTFAKFLEDHIQNIHITWVDIDPSMIQISQDIFHIQNKDLIIWDAFDILDVLFQRNDDKYDSILIDCYGWDSKIPNNLIHIDFFEKCKKILHTDWIVSINMANFEKEKVIYQELHKNITSVFWKYFSLFLSWKNDIWNMVWIYNWDKNYRAKDFTKKFQEQVKKGEIKNNEEILKNTYVDEKKLYLS